MSSSTHAYANHYVTAFFDERSDAEAAVARLVEEGVARDDIRMVAGVGVGTSTAEPAVREKGFFESLGDLFMPDDDRHAYAEGLRRGGYLVTVPTTAANRDRVLDILDDEGTVDIDERAESWRSEGWSGLETGYVAESDRVAVGAGSIATDGKPMTPVASGRETALAAARPASARDADYDGTIDVVEENLRVGKRDVSHGRVRVKSYVVEEAVSEDVNLRSERVEIERRAVDRPVDSFDGAFTDRTLELEETAEEAVVSKTARVKEEIDLRKVASDRVETVSDTVRRTEVEVEDERTGRILTGEDRARKGL